MEIVKLDQIGSNELSWTKSWQKHKNHLLVAIDGLVRVGNVEEEVLFMVLLKEIRIQMIQMFLHMLGRPFTKDQPSTNAKVHKEFWKNSPKKQGKEERITW